MGATLQKETKHNVASDYQEGGNNVIDNESHEVPDGTTGSALSNVEPVCNGRVLVVQACHVPEQD